MTFLDTGGLDSVDALTTTADKAAASANALSVSATQFANAMARAFTQATSGGKQFDDVLKSLALRLSNLTLTAAFQPLTTGASGALLGVSTLAASMGAIKPFAAGGVIGTPTYFPLTAGGVGLAGEAGPEAIMPLRRGADGRLGVAMNSGAGGSVTVQIATPDPASFRRSEAYLAGQIARAVARGQRGF